MTDDSPGESYILITKAGRPPSSERLEDPLSIASQVARTRGQGELAKMTVDRQVKPLGDPLTIDEDEQIVMRFDDGTIVPESGYVMQFVDRRYVSSELSVFDIAGIPELTRYPVPSTAVESLPEVVLNKVDSQEYVKFTGAYSKDSSEFFNVTLGWNSDSVDPLEKIIRVSEQTGSATKSLDYVLFLYGPPEWQDEEAIAQYRGVQPETVRQNIVDVAEQLDEEVGDAVTTDAPSQ